METSVSDTIYSLIGIKPLIDDILVKITEPLRHHLWESSKGESRRYDLDNSEPRNRLNRLPKFVLITGKHGCGKRSLVSAIVNELRRGMGRKAADIYHSDMNVKFLDWYGTPWDFELDEYLVNIIDLAKSRNDGRDFTVIFFERFETVCPSEGRNREAAEENFIQALKREVKSCPAGVVLFAAATSYPDEVDPDIMELVDITLDVPQYSETTKKHILRSFFELECVEISEPNLDFIITTVGSRSPRCLKSIAIEATDNARIRTNENLNLEELGHRRVKIERQDLAWLTPRGPREADVNENEEVEVIVLD